MNKFEKTMVCVLFIMFGTISYSLGAFAKNHYRLVADGPVKVEKEVPVPKEEEVSDEQKRYYRCFADNNSQIMHWAHQCVQLVQLEEGEGEEEWYDKATPCFKAMSQAVEVAQEDCQDKAEQ